MQTYFAKLISSNANGLIKVQKDVDGNPSKILLFNNGVYQVHTKEQGQWRSFASILKDKIIIPHSKKALEKLESKLNENNKKYDPR